MQRTRKSRQILNTFTSQFLFQQNLAQNAYFLAKKENETFVITKNEIIWFQKSFRVTLIEQFSNVMKSLSKLFKQKEVILPGHHDSHWLSDGYCWAGQFGPVLDDGLSNPPALFANLQLGWWESGNGSSFYELFLSNSIVYIINFTFCLVKHNICDDCILQFKYSSKTTATSLIFAALNTVLCEFSRLTKDAPWNVFPLILRVHGTKLAPSPPESHTGSATFGRGPSDVCEN